jgi:predicted RNA binding protein YcfA (HicA-like mRNA interferase family)
MGTLDKLKRDVVKNPRAVRFNDIVVVLRALGYDLVRTSGSHCIFRPSSGGQSILIVRPHGTRAYCAAVDVKKVVELLAKEAAHE